MKKKMPLHANLKNNSIKIRPGWRTGVIAELPTKVSKSIIMRIVDSSGLPLPINSTLKLEHGDHKAMVGHNGKVYLANIGNISSLTGEVEGDGNSCKINAIIAEGGKHDIINLGDVLCE